VEKLLYEVASEGPCAVSCPGSVDDGGCFVLDNIDFSELERPPSDGVIGAEPTLEGVLLRSLSVSLRVIAV
jgi:hypothetical protein